MSWILRDSCLSIKNQLCQHPLSNFIIKTTDPDLTLLDSKLMSYSLAFRCKTICENGGKFKVGKCVWGKTKISAKIFPSLSYHSTNSSKYQWIWFWTTCRPIALSLSKNSFYRINLAIEPWSQICPHFLDIFSARFLGTANWSSLLW